MVSSISRKKKKKKKKKPNETKTGDLEHRFNLLKNELTAAREELQLEKEQLASYKAITASNSTELKEMSDAYETYRAATEKVFPPVFFLDFFAHFL